MYPLSLSLCGRWHLVRGWVLWLQPASSIISFSCLCLSVHRLHWCFHLNDSAVTADWQCVYLVRALLCCSYCHLECIIFAPSQSFSSSSQNNCLWLIKWDNLIQQPLVYQVRQQIVCMILFSVAGFWHTYAFSSSFCSLSCWFHTTVVAKNANMVRWTLFVRVGSILNIFAICHSFLLVLCYSLRANELNLHAILMVCGMKVPMMIMCWPLITSFWHSGRPISIPKLL